jgi:guanylate kinase
MEALRHRLTKRGTDSEENIERRLALAEQELTASVVYKYNVVNDDLNDCVSRVNEILNYELEAHNRTNL